MIGRTTIGVLLIAGWLLGGITAHGAGMVKQQDAEAASDKPAPPVQMQSVDASQAVFVHFRMAGELMAAGKEREALEHAADRACTLTMSCHWLADLKPSEQANELRATILGDAK